MAYKAAIVVLLFACCASANAQEPSGKIIFYRDSQSSDYKPPVFCDSAELANVGNSEYIEVTAPPGRHPCVAESALELPTYVQVESGRASYQKVEVTRGKDRHAFLVTSNQGEFNRQKHLKRMEVRQFVTLPSLEPLANEPIPEGVYHSGVDGVGVPRCVYCPDPRYTDRGRRAKIQGSVILQVVIGVDGKASDIRFLARLGLDMDEQSANAVKTWRFEPARGPNGQSVPVVVPIEIMFRLF